jgi:hypothetical protein
MGDAVMGQGVAQCANDCLLADDFVKASGTGFSGKN